MYLSSLYCQLLLYQVLAIPFNFEVIYFFIFLTNTDKDEEVYWRIRDHIKKPKKKKPSDEKMSKAETVIAEDTTQFKDWVKLEESKDLVSGSVDFGSRKKEVQSDEWNSCFVTNLFEWLKVSSLNFSCLNLSFVSHTDQ